MGKHTYLCRNPWLEACYMDQSDLTPEEIKIYNNTAKNRDTSDANQNAFSDDSATEHAEIISAKVDDAIGRSSNHRKRKKSADRKIRSKC